jgi:hypothetical protein
MANTMFGRAAVAACAGSPAPIENCVAHYITRALVAFSMRLRVLFVGNSFTSGRAPVVQYNNANVVDVNAQNAIDKLLGSEAITPNPWGGVPGIFKTMVDQALLSTDVLQARRGGATLRDYPISKGAAACTRK